MAHPDRHARVVVVGRRPPELRFRPKATVSCALIRAAARLYFRMSHTLPHAVRFWAVALLLLPVATSAFAQNASSDLGSANDADWSGEVVLRCQVAERLPTNAAEASAGGFAFSYQSVAGLMADGRSCAVYRLRNLPGQPPTPVRWRADDEVLVDTAHLARCADEASCGWLEVARYFEGVVLVGKTELSFGLNADSFHHEDQGLVASTEPSIGASTASVGSELVARLMLGDGSVLDLHVLVKSYFRRNRTGLELVYDVLAEDPTLLDGSRVRFEWDAFADVPPTLTRLLQREDRSPFMLPATRDVAHGSNVSAGDAVLAGEPRLDRGRGVVVLVVPVESFLYVADLSLSVVDISDSGKRLLTITMPAFVPGTEP